MVEIDAVARELSSIEKIIDAVLNLDAKVQNALWRRKARAILGRLRDLYFREEGTLGFLRCVAESEPVPAGILEEVKSHFYQQEEIVTEALSDLREKCDFEDIRLTIDETELIAGIIYDKTLIRELVKRIFHALEEGNVGDRERDQARKLCESIESLNAKFRDADARLRKHL